MILGTILIVFQVTMFDNYDDILRCINLDDPAYDLELIDISKLNFDPISPANIMNRALDKFKDKFIFGHLNARSLNKNHTELGQVLDKTYFDAFSVSESWLTKNTPKDRFMFNDFNIVRSDRKNKRGGGVCLFIRKQYSKFRKINIPNMCEMPEMLWVEIEVGRSKIAIGTLYKPPKIPCSAFRLAYDSLIHIYSKYEHTILAGDFNVNLFNPDSYESRVLADSLIEPFSLKQMVTSATRITDKSKTLIDLILVTRPENILCTGVCDAPGISDHCFTYCAYNIKRVKFQPYVVKRRDFRNFDREAFYQAIEFEPWENILCVDSVDDKVSVLENLINSILDKFAPYKSFVVNNKSATPWITDEILEKMDERDGCKDTFNKTGENVYWEAYKYLRNKVTAMMRASQKKVFNDTINSNISNSGAFYKAAAKLHVIPNKKSKPNFNFSADALNKAFTSNNNKKLNEDFINSRISNLYKKTNPCIHKFSFAPVSEEEVIKIVKSIKSKSSGIDGINISTILLFLPRITTVLTNIINVSFELNQFPERWKKALITPIPKCEVPLQESDFRPISLLPTFSKVLEKAANIQIVAYLLKHDLLDPYQSAYRKNHSTFTALLKITYDILDSIDDSNITLLIFLDFSKAFDTVNHKILLAKLKILGFQNDTCEWIHSYLSNRSQQVLCGNVSSDWIHIENGVPQGSILGPLLFTILVSDMRWHIWDGSYHQYADDTDLLLETSVDNINVTIGKANNVLEKISTYCNDNFLNLNAGKTKFMFIGSRPAIKKLETIHLHDLTIDGTVLERVKIAKNLGITFDELLSWTKHINLNISKAVGSFINLSRFKRFLNMKSKVLLCESIILSRFNYCDAVYLNIDMYLQKKIQKIQDMCCRFIFDKKRSENCNYLDMRKQLGWLSMNQRRELHCMTMMYKILHGFAPNYLQDMFSYQNEIHTCNVNTRGSQDNQLWIDKSIKSKVHRDSFKFYVPCQYNKLPTKIRDSTSVNSFKTNLIKFLKIG